MDNEAILMRKQMDETLAALTEKLGELEQQVTGTVRTVQSSVNTVRDSFDIKLQVRQRPWTFVAGAAALGVLGGLRFRGRGVASPAPTAGSADPNRFQAARRPAAQAPTWMASLGDAFQPELAELKGMVIGAALALARDLIVKQTSKPADRSIGEPVNGHTDPLEQPLATPPRTREL